MERREFLEDVKADDARLVGEAVLDPQKYLKSSDEIRATVDRFKEWLEANKKIGTWRVASVALRDRSAKSKGLTHPHRQPRSLQQIPQVIVYHHSHQPGPVAELIHLEM